MRDFEVHFSAFRRITNGWRNPRAVPAGALALALAFVVWVSPVAAQTTGASTDAGQIERRIDDAAPPPRREPERGAELPDLPTEAGDDEIEFILAAVSLLGVETLSAEALASTYEDLLARTVTTADAAEIANRITRIYRDAGYALSRAFVPPQTIDTGVLTVQVAEGSVIEVVFEGLEEMPLDLEPYARAIRDERPLTLDTLERNILLIGDLPGIDVARSSLDEAEEGSGAFRLTLVIEYDAVDGTAYVDNRGTPSVGRLQSWLSGGANSLFGQGERLQAGLFTVPNQPEELLYKEVSYLQPLGSAGTEALLSASHSVIDAGSSSGELNTESESYRFSLRLSHPIIRSRTENLWINGFAEYRNAEESQSGAENFDDRLRVVRARLNYNRSGETFFSSAVLRVSQGLDVLGASEERSGPLSRFDGAPKFTKVSADLSHAQSIYGGLSVQVSAIGQKSANSLLASEEFAIGGSRFGRAYDFAELTGEDGVAGSLELRYSFEDTGDLLESLQVFGFYDNGAVWNRNATDTFRRHSLSSAGIGVRVNLPRSIFIGLEAAKPLTRQVATSGGNTDPRYFFSLSVGF
ncbi:MAG: BamA/TamA family outer membrane protein [Proteobacteria bacterium]|nr:BamA/TamA family outer membrane protein [Pseudomonadota bacterium]